MLSTIITTANATGVFCPPDGLAIEIRGIQIDVPLNEVGTTDSSLTLSGLYTGVVTVHSDTTFTKQFGYNECVHWSADFASSEHSAFLDYLLVGSMDCIMPTLSGMKDNFIPIPRRLK